VESLPLPLRRLAVCQLAQQLRPLLEDLVLHGVAYAEVRRPLTEHRAGDDEHVDLDRKIDEQLAHYHAFWNGFSIFTPRTTCP